MLAKIMSSEYSYNQSVTSSTHGSNTPGFDTPSSISETMSSTPILTAELQISSPAYENMRRSFQDTFSCLGVEMLRLEIENNRLVEHNTAIEKELETLKKENARLFGARDDAIKKLTGVEEEKAELQKELDESRELDEVRRWKKKCEELENRAIEGQARMEKLSEDYQQKMEKHIADYRNQSRKTFEQEIDRIKAGHTQQMQTLTSVLGVKGLEDMQDGYISREKPFKIIPRGMIQVSRAKSRGSDVGCVSNCSPCENKNTRFLYVIRDQYKDFKKFTALAESVFGLAKDHISFLKGTKSNFLYYDDDKSKVINKWEKEVSQKDHIYIQSGWLAGIIYYVED
ncbi:hypothetical protein BZA77DRAFT_343359 [Pyronema omphalodes]|nr:hypothetical protein BZA77DRAFT_343359 [Pyronema omphalodes]